MKLRIILPLILICFNQIKSNIPGVVFVDVMNISENTQEFKDMKFVIEKKIKEKVSSIESLSKQIEERALKLKNGAKDMKEEKKQELREEMARLNGELEMKKRTIESFVEQEVHNAEGYLAKKVKDTVEKLAKENKWSLVFTHTGVLYFDPSIDRSSSVVSTLNSDFEKSKKVSTTNLPTQKIVSNSSNQ